MTDYAGTIIGARVSFEIAAYTPVIRERQNPQTEIAGVLRDDLNSGSFELQQPIREIAQQFNGAITHTFFNDYYNKVYAIPASIEFGPISGTIRRNLVLWNAHLFGTTFTEAAPSQIGGVFFVGDALPRAFKPLEVATYIVEAGDEGPAALNGHYTLTFDHGGQLGLEVLTVPVTGTRARVSPLRPNWRDKFSVGYEFKTEIITSRTGREQRRALRQSPRKSIEFTASVHRAAKRRIDQNMASWHSRTILMPERPREATAFLGLGPGEADLTLAGPAPAWAIPGVNVMLVWQGIEEPRVIGAVEDEFVTFDSVSDTDFPAGTKMVYVVSGTFPQTLQTKRLTNEVAEVAVVFEVTPASEPAFPVPAASISFNGREVFLQRPNWQGGASVEYGRPIDLVDYGRGKTGRFSAINFETLTRKFEYIARNVAEAESALAFFLRMKGRRGEFYAPTWENDIVPAVVARATSSNLRTEGFGIFDNYAEDTVHRALIVFPELGEPLLRRVVSISRAVDDLGSHSAIQVDTPWPFDISPDTVKQICWMPAHRLSSDSFSLEWQTTKAAQYALTMQTVEDLP